MNPETARLGLRGLWLLVRRSLRQHWLASSVTAAAVGLGCGLVMAVFAIQHQAERAFIGGPIGYDAVLGTRGSKLQLVLNSVFHLDVSPGNLPWRVYEEIAALPFIELAVPYAVGDNYRGFRLVGTTTQQFTDYRDGDGFPLEFASGAVFEEGKRQAVLGSFAAARTKLAVGDQFQPIHGLSDGHQHDETFDVVGVLAPTNSPMDRVIWVPLYGVYHMAGHVLRGSGEIYDPAVDGEQGDAHGGHDDHGHGEHGHDDHHHGHDHGDHAHEDAQSAQQPSGVPLLEQQWSEESGHEGHDHDHAHEDPHSLDIPKEHLEVSAVMLKLRGPQAGFALDEIVNRRGTEATVAWPISKVMADFFGRLGWMTYVLELVAYLVVLVSAGGVLASIYNTINERRRQFAILRALGARRRTVFMAIVAECMTIAAAGAVLGIVFYAVLLTFVTTLFRERIGVVIDPLTWHPALLWTPLGVIALGALVGLIPAWKAYGTDVAENLTPQT